MDDIDTDFLHFGIRHAIGEISSEYENYPPLQLQEIWINGSYGASAETPDSDIDITIEIGIIGDSNQKTPKEARRIASHIHGLSGRLTRAIEIDTPALPDVTTIPSEDLLDIAEIDAPTATEHVQQTQRNGGYDTVYDMRADAYTSIENL